jgi:hypothetical protein
LGIAIFGERGVWGGLAGVVVLLACIFFGLVWLFSELRRRQREHQLNAEYEREIHEMRAQAQRKRRQWLKELAASQLTARNQYDGEMARWREETAAARGEVARRQREWAAKLAADQEGARKRHEAELAEWNRIATIIRDEAHRRKAAWEAELAAKQQAARREHEVETRRWEQIVAAVTGEATRRRREAEDSRHRLAATERAWAAAAARFDAEFDRKKTALELARTSHMRLAGAYAADLQKLQSNVRELQLQHFLDEHFINDHRIKGIGSHLKSMLEKCGVETALDVVDATVAEVPGFGPDRTARLIQWRLTIEGRFFFDSAKGIPIPERQAFEAKYRQMRQAVEAPLSAGAQELRQITAMAEQELTRRYEEIKSALQRMAQAEADLDPIPPGL